MQVTPEPAGLQFPLAWLTHSWLHCSVQQLCEVPQISATQSNIVVSSLKLQLDPSRGSPTVHTECLQHVGSTGYMGAPVAGSQLSVVHMSLSETTGVFTWTHRLVAVSQLSVVHASLSSHCVASWHGPSMLLPPLLEFVLFELA